jgi:hypothetical protein
VEQLFHVKFRVPEKNGSDHNGQKRKNGPVVEQASFGIKLATYNTDIVSVLKPESLGQDFSTLPLTIGKHEPKEAKKKEDFLFHIQVPSLNETFLSIICASSKHARNPERRSRSASFFRSEFPCLLLR